jgi:hypothetical protein
LIFSSSFPEEKTCGRTDNCGTVKIVGREEIIVSRSCRIKQNKISFPAHNGKFFHIHSIEKCIKENFRQRVGRRR